MTRIAALVVFSIVFQYAFSDVSSFSTTATNSYYYTDHHEVVIDRSADQVWPHLINLGSWMYDFSMEHYSGPVNKQGEVLRLYQGQDYFFELAKLVPNELLVGINLPIATPEGEVSTGLAMISLTETDGRTVVSVFMNRKYSWPHSDTNPVREIRNSAEFAENRNKTFGRFLARLKDLSEK